MAEGRKRVGGCCVKPQSKESEGEEGMGQLGRDVSAVMISFVCIKSIYLGGEEKERQQVSTA